MNSFLKVLVSIALILVVAAILLANGRQPAPFPPGSQAARWLEAGPYEVREREEEFIDYSRPTAANGEFAGEDFRRLPGTVWHPAVSEGAPYPLVVFSHGFTSSRAGGAYLGEHLASIGYVVVAVDYPLTSMAAPGGPNARDVVNQPADVSFLIDTLLASARKPDDPLYAMIDGDRIGVTGISLGGLTTTLVAYHPELGDPRVAAALSIAGPTSIFTHRFFESPSVPFLMLAGDIDALIPYRTNAVPVLDKVPGSQLVTVAGGSHTAFSGPSAPLRWMDNPDAIGCFAVTENLGNVDDDPWYDELGTPEQGINYNAENELCQVDPLPTAINALRQQMITKVVVSGFFESHFARADSQRELASRFLGQALASELPEVSHQAAAGRRIRAGESTALGLE
jgi:dienelactone hydrolase